jgi:hypothetical protein
MTKGGKEMMRGIGSSIVGRIPIRIWIQSGSRVLMTKNLIKVYSWKILDIFLIKNCNLLSALKRDHPSNTSKHEIFNFFIFLWVFFALLDPDPLI